MVLKQVRLASSMREKKKCDYMIFRVREQSELVWTSSKVKNVDSGTESHLIMFVNEYRLRYPERSWLPSQMESLNDHRLRSLE